MGKKWKAAPALAAALALLAAGCGEAPEAPQPSRKDGAYNFVFVCPILHNEYWEECVLGIEKADQELGTSTRTVGPWEADNFAEEIAGYMEEAIASQPDGIIGYAGIEDLYPLIDQAVAEGIPFLAIDSDAPGTARAAYIGTDLYTLGYRAGEALVQLTEGKGKVGYICSTFSAESEETVFNAFQDAISDYDLEVVASVEGHADPDYAAGVTEGLLKAHPEITAIFCTAGYNATGAARVKQERSLHDLVLVGCDDVAENLAFVREGAIDALLVQSPYQMGYQGVYRLKEYVDNGSLPQENYDTGSILVTRRNVDTYNR